MQLKCAIYIVRHGETEWARDGKHTGLTDIPLTEKGEIQAANLGRRLEKIKFAHVFSSPLKRALETCTICGFDPQIDKDLVEWDYGAYEGMKSSEIHETNPKWTIFTDGAPAGESVEEVKKRCKRLLNKLEGLEGNIALFSSGHISRALLTQWLDLPIATAQQFLLDTASLSILEIAKNTPSVKLWNDISHRKC